MKRLRILGKKYMLIEKNTGKDKVQFKTNKIFVNSKRRPSDHLLKEFLYDLLYSELFKVYRQIRNERKVDIFGNLNFEVSEKIDNKKHRVAKLKENKIIVKINAVSLPKSALKYIIAHEMAHVVTKKHSKNFWKIVETIYPGFEEGQKTFINNEKFLKESITKNLR